MSISKAAQELGRKGGQAKSPAKTAAARANASKPRGKWVTAVAYKAVTLGVEYIGVAMRKGRLSENEAIDLVTERMHILHRVDDFTIIACEIEELKA